MSEPTKFEMKDNSFRIARRSQAWVDRWSKSDYHIRGCMLEGLAQDLDFTGELKATRIFVSNCLRMMGANIK